MKAFLFLLICAPFVARSQAGGTVKGVITFFFNEYQGDKPDVGAKIFAADTADVPGFSLDLCDSFYQAKTYRNIAGAYESRGIKPPEDVHAKLLQYGADNIASFTDMDHRNARQLMQLQFDKKTKSATVDGAGNFSIQLPTGVYYIFVQSNGRKGISASEIMGKAIVKKVHVTSSGETNISTRFDEY
jgi:hypothetical protein